MQSFWGDISLYAQTECTIKNCFRTRLVSLLLRVVTSWGHCQILASSSNECVMVAVDVYRVLVSSDCGTQSKHPKLLMLERWGERSMLTLVTTLSILLWVSTSVL